MIIEYVLALVLGMVVDGVWLGVISKSLYQKYIGDLMLQTPRLVPAVIFYFIFALAAVVFITHPAIQDNWSFWNILAHAALLGLVIYGAYDLTNLSILKGWPIAISIIDILWGVAFSSIVSLATVYIARLWL